MDDHSFIIKQKPPKGEDGYRTFSIRIKEDTVAQIEDIAQHTGHSRNELIGMLLEYALSHSKIEPFEES